MHYYKDLSNNVYALSEQDISNGGLSFLPKDASEIAEREWKDLLEPTADDQKSNLMLLKSFRLQAIDLETLRPLRAVYAGTDTAEDHTKLTALEEEAQQLRQELANAN